MSDATGKKPDRISAPAADLPSGGAAGAVAPLSAGCRSGEFTSPDIVSAPAADLPFWMDGEEARKLCRAAQNFFQTLGNAAIWPAQQLNPLECSLPVLDLMAWQRCVKRYAGEPERLYRLRVTHAYANAVDAGQTAGWGRIFQRLELGGVSLRERVPGQDWDRIGISADDSQFPDQQNVLEIIIEDYGRTCRRYYFDSRITRSLTDRLGTFDEDHCTLTARADDRNLVASPGYPAVFDHISTTMEARA